MGDLGWRWSRISKRKIRPIEESFACLSLSRFIVHSKTRLPLCCEKPARNSFNWLFDHEDYGFSVFLILRVIVRNVVGHLLSG